MEVAVGDGVTGIAVSVAAGFAVWLKLQAEAMIKIVAAMMERGWG